MRKQSLVALLGATAIMALPVITPDLAGGGSHAYAAGARGGDANGGRGARGGRGGRGGDGGASTARAVGVRAATAAPAVMPRASGAQPMLTVAVAVLADWGRTLLAVTAALVPKAAWAASVAPVIPVGPAELRPAARRTPEVVTPMAATAAAAVTAAAVATVATARQRATAATVVPAGAVGRPRPASATRMLMVAPVVPVVTDPSPRVAMAATVPQVVPVVPVATAEWAVPAGRLPSKVERDVHALVQGREP